MIAFLTLVYVGVLVVLVKMRVIRPTIWVKLSPIAVNLLLLVFLFVPMMFTAPSGDAIVLRHSVQIVPEVGGLVLEVPVEPNVPLQKGDVLFRIDPTPYEASVEQLGADLELARTRLEQSEQLLEREAGSLYEVQAYRSQVAQLEAGLKAATYQLDRTTVRAPSDGYVTNMALRPGTRVGVVSPVMAFIDTTETVIGVQMAQIYVRNIEAGQDAEFTLKCRPGRVYKARVEAVIEATRQGQIAPGGWASEVGPILPLPFGVRLEIDDEKLAAGLPAGAAGTAAIYTGKGKMTYPIRMIMMRMDAWLNYVIPF
jgi:multidrug resistance efflux pump